MIIIIAARVFEQPEPQALSELDKIMIDLANLLTSPNTPQAVFDLIANIICELDNMPDPNSQPKGILFGDPSHDQDLVRQINDAYDANTKIAFNQIIYALYQRDADECLDKGLPFPKNIKDMDENYVEMYLHQIADDADLETILSFVNYKKNL